RKPYFVLIKFPLSLPATETAAAPDTHHSRYVRLPRLPEQEPCLHSSGAVRGFFHSAGPLSGTAHNLPPSYATDAGDPSSAPEAAGRWTDLSRQSLPSRTVLSRWKQADPADGSQRSLAVRRYKSAGNENERPDRTAG